MVLLAGYLTALILVPIHEAFHTEAAEEICLEEDNACHLRVVHHDVENGCDHESHLAEDSLSCELCALLQHKKAANYQVFQTEKWLIDQTSFVNLQKSIYNRAQVANHLTRGPPVSS